MAPRPNRGLNELRVEEFLERNGFVVMRVGWPDMMAVRVQDGRLLPIEVKGPDEQVSHGQVGMQALLSRAGLETLIIETHHNVPIVRARWWNVGWDEWESMRPTVAGPIW